MNLLSNNVNTKSRSNYDEDFKKYISGMKSAYEELNQVVEQHGSLVYDLDYQYRANLRECFEFLEITLIKMLSQNGYFKSNIYKELFDFYVEIAELAIQANRHDFLIITAMKMQMLTDFVYKNID